MSVAAKACCAALAVLFMAWFYHVVTVPVNVF